MCSRAGGEKLRRLWAGSGDLDAFGSGALRPRAYVRACGRNRRGLRDMRFHGGLIPRGLFHQRQELAPFCVELRWIPVRAVDLGRIELPLCSLFESASERLPIHEGQPFAPRSCVARARPTFAWRPVPREWRSGRASPAQPDSARGEVGPVGAVERGGFASNRQALVPHAGRQESRAVSCKPWTRRYHSQGTPGR